MQRCDCCGVKFGANETTILSSVYGAYDIWLCESCAEREQELIEDGNDKPKLLAQYKEQRAKNRRKR
jgi:hypothetical protein